MMVNLSVRLTLPINYGIAICQRYYVRSGKTSNYLPDVRTEFIVHRSPVNLGSSSSDMSNTHGSFLVQKVVVSSTTNSGFYFLFFLLVKWKRSLLRTTVCVGA